MVRVLLAAVAAGVLAGVAAGQTADAPTTLSGQDVDLVSYAANNMQVTGYQPTFNNYFYTLVDAGGAAGVGYTTTAYGTTNTNGGQFPSTLTLRGTALDPARLAYATAGTAANGAVVGPPAAFDRTQPQTFKIYNPGLPESYIRFDLSGGTDPDPDYAYPGLTLTQKGAASPTATLATANALLNDVLKFDPSAFYVAPNQTADATVGTFSFQFDPESLDQTTTDTMGMAGNGYVRIELVFTPTPVPEPGLLLAAAAIGLAVRRVGQRKGRDSNPRTV